MPGFGPPPKDPSRRARANKDPVPHTILQFVRGDQPELPEDAGVEWHGMTRRWWDMWARSEQAKLFTDTDWSFLLDTARIHTAFWNGAAAAGPELRVRVSKFGATPEDRARLRMFFADADRKDAERTTNSEPKGSKNYGNLRLAD